MFRIDCITLVMLFHSLWSVCGQFVVSSVFFSTVFLSRQSICSFELAIGKWSKSACVTDAICPNFTCSFTNFFSLSFFFSLSPSPSLSFLKLLDANWSPSILPMPAAYYEHSLSTSAKNCFASFLSLSRFLSLVWLLLTQCHLGICAICSSKLSFFSFLNFFPCILNSFQSWFSFKCVVDY